MARRALPRIKHAREATRLPCHAFSVRPVALRPHLSMGLPLSSHPCKGQGSCYVPIILKPRASLNRKIVLFSLAHLRRRHPRASMSSADTPSTSALFRASASVKQPPLGFLCAVTPYGPSWTRLHPWSSLSVNVLFRLTYQVTFDNITTRACCHQPSAACAVAVEGIVAGPA